MELTRLRLYDLDIERGVIVVRQGKGKKDRVIPIGDRALAWVDKYLTEVRPQLVHEPDTGVLLLSLRGDPLTGESLYKLVKTALQQADIDKRGSCHLFRHTMATHMLENGADIRYIQQMLGHVKIETTQIYTQVSIRKLKQIHTATHPARLKRKK